jgi:hypothetical protein
VKVDYGPVGYEAAALMDTLSVDDLPEGATVREVMVIVAVTWPVANEDAEGNSVYYRCSSAYPWVQTGLLDKTREAISSASRPADEEE